MNEQIQSILNENGTKTSKIQKLLALGLTRRQVADLVANATTTPTTPTIGNWLPTAAFAETTHSNW